MFIPKSKVFLDTSFYCALFGFDGEERQTEAQEKINKIAEKKYQIISSYEIIFEVITKLTKGRINHIYIDVFLDDYYPKLEIINCGLNDNDRIKNMFDYWKKYKFEITPADLSCKYYVDEDEILSNKTFFITYDKSDFGKLSLDIHDSCYL